MVWAMWVVVYAAFQLHGAGARRTFSVVLAYVPAHNKHGGGRWTFADLQVQLQQAPPHRPVGLN